MLYISQVQCFPEAADPTNAWRLFPPVFRRRHMKGQDVMTSNVACHAMLWTENSNEHPNSRPAKTWYRNHTKPAGLIRITTYDSSERLNFSNLWNLLRIWDYRPFSVLKTLTGSREVSQNMVSSSEHSVNQTLDFRSIKHFRIAWLALIDIWLFRLAKIFPCCETYWEYRTAGRRILAFSQG